MELHTNLKLNTIIMLNFHVFMIQEFVIITQ